MDGQVGLVHLVRLVHLQTDTFRLSLHKKNGQTTNFRLHDEQPVNGLRKIVLFSVFRLIWQHANININMYIYVYTHTCTH